MPILPPGDLHPTQMSVDQLGSLPTITKGGRDPVVIFFKSGVRWGVFDSGTPGMPFWVAAYGGKDPNPELGDRIA